MSKKYKNKNNSALIVIILLLIVLVGVLGLVSKGYQAWNLKEWFNNSTDNSNIILTVNDFEKKSVNNKIHYTFESNLEELNITVDLDTFSFNQTIFEFVFKLKNAEKFTIDFVCDEVDEVDLSYGSYQIYTNTVGQLIYNSNYYYDEFISFAKFGLMCGTDEIGNGFTSSFGIYLSNYFTTRFIKENEKVIIDLYAYNYELS